MREQILPLQPLCVWRFFYDICKIPHTSHNLEKISEYIINFAKERGLSYVKDKAGNILIHKPATKGMEMRKGIIIQSHIDMVGQKTHNSSHNFSTDPLTIFVDNGWVRAKDTSLGADNGIGVAATLAILDNNEISHPEIEALFTTDEECGMEGATLLDKEFLKHSIMINTDSEEDNSAFIGCAGAIDFKASLNYTNEVCDIKGRAYKLTIRGLKGGHSGVDIHRGRGNANKLLVRFLNFCIQAYGIRISEIIGGDTRNAIPRYANAIVVVNENDCEDFLKEVTLFSRLYQSEYNIIDDAVLIDCQEVNMPIGILPMEFQRKFINVIDATPDGVERMIPGIEDTVETSSNLAIVNCKDGIAWVQILVRSTMNSRKYNYISSLWSLYSLVDAEVELFGDYPSWTPNLNSPILNIAKDFYKTSFGEDLKTKVMHAGLECGIISSLYPNLDMISIGPNMLHPHSPDERVEIASVEKFWNFLLGILKNSPEQSC